MPCLHPPAPIATTAFVRRPGGVRLRPGTNPHEETNQRAHTFTSLLTTAVIATALTITACGGDSGAQGAGASGEHTDDISRGVDADPAAAALVPADVREEGVLVVAMDLTSPPTTFMASDNKTLIGFNPDMAPDREEARPRSRDPERQVRHDHPGPRRRSPAGCREWLLTR